VALSSSSSSLQRVVDVITRFIVRVTTARGVKNDPGQLFPEKRSCADVDSVRSSRARPRRTRRPRVKYICDRRNDDGATFTALTHACSLRLTCDENSFQKAERKSQNERVAKLELERDDAQSRAWLPLPLPLPCRAVLACWLAG